MNRFNKFVAERNNPSATNGHSLTTKTVKSEQNEQSEPLGVMNLPKQEVRVKREHEEDDDELSEVSNSPPPKKKRKQIPAVDEDAAFAAKLQAEENSRARPTRGGVTRKTMVTKKKKKTPKKKTFSKAKAEDSDVEGSGSEAGEKKVNRTGGFHVRRWLTQRLS